ncbi:hypothetical protein CNMCM6936_003699 [Aspergillus lentulus]|uniref:Uncharacterized protein n=1 Tax=Aspergillus lentulus TaxID=293939 RepID=A0AAN5YSX8_ASPLE|nr:hypothetical protein CNMCM6069_004720 [Aspergillus lentulus]KAF4168104.1 hypothetical protein CNMCM6936_003699 [Aspergillus lentulus]KAF4206064.1 hypothetical protein CNMCM8927_005470 [Aspergillus lentulus]
MVVNIYSEGGIAEEGAEEEGAVEEGAVEEGAVEEGVAEEAANLKVPAEPSGSTLSFEWGENLTSNSLQENDGNLWYSNNKAGDFPFEGAGVVSKWHIELANELRAIAGGDRQAAIDAASKDLEAAGVIEIPDLRTRLPHIMSRGHTSVKRVKLYLKFNTDPDRVKSVSPTVDGTKLDKEDAPVGDFVIKSYEESIALTNSWKVNLKDGSTAREGKLDVAWLLITYAVMGLV